MLQERATGLEPATSSLGRRPVYGRTFGSTTVLEVRTSRTPQNKTVDPSQKTDLVDPRWTPPRFQLAYMPLYPVPSTKKKGIRAIGFPC
jgi:hypothetical protein